MALAQAKLDLTETRLAEMPAPTGEAGWAGEARAAAVAVYPHHHDHTHGPGGEVVPLNPPPAAGSGG